MTALRAGTRLSFTYECRDEHGALLESLDAPAEITVGNGDILPRLEEALAAMQPGQSRQLMLEPDQAFGPQLDEMVGFFPYDLLPNDPPPVLGDVLEVENKGDDEPLLATVVSVEEDGCTLDGNHPLAGRDLYFTLRLVAILDA